MLARGRAREHAVARAQGRSLVDLPAARSASPSLWLAIKATFAGAGLNNILVANGGEAARVVFVARAAHVPSAKVLATLALERMFELDRLRRDARAVGVVPRAAAVACRARVRSPGSRSSASPC